MHGRLFIISAPSGAGKTSLVKAALERLRPEYRIEPVVTYTTKVPRHGERQNTDYCFLDVVPTFLLVSQAVPPECLIRR